MMTNAHPRSDVDSTLPKVTVVGVAAIEETAVTTP